MADNQVVALPNTKPKLFCFVLMPFAPEFNDVYQIGIKEACENAGAYCERLDEQIFTERMLDRIYNQISKADVIVADMTSQNANVFYEVGYAHALGKPTILITNNASDIPFDLKHFPHIIYSQSLMVLRSKLSERIRWHVKNPAGTDNISNCPLDVFVNGNNAINGCSLVFASEPHNSNASCEFQLTIGRSRIAKNVSCCVGLITSSIVEQVSLPGRTYWPTKTPEGNHQFVIISDEGLLSGQFESLSLFIAMPLAASKAQRQWSLKVFSEQSSYDFNIEAKYDHELSS